MFSNAAFSNQYLIIKDNADRVIDCCNNICEKPSPKNERDFQLLNESLNMISKVLIENKDFYAEEYKCFVKIEKYIIYIVGENSQKRGIDCVKYLLNIFLDLLNAKFNNPNEYNDRLCQYPKRLREFRAYFRKNIFTKDCQFDNAIDSLNAAMQI